VRGSFVALKQMPRKNPDARDFLEMKTRKGMFSANKFWGGTIMPQAAAQNTSCGNKIREAQSVGGALLVLI
jgi:hypothetical protein